MSSKITNSFSPLLSNNIKAIALETTLQQSLQDFKDLLYDFDQLYIECEKYKSQLTRQKEKCDSNKCSSAECLRKTIIEKDNIIQLVASTLTRLNETKDLKILDEVFKILFGDTTNYNTNVNKNENIEKLCPINIKMEKTDDMSFNNESVSEIEGTPTGRISPIIQTKKLKSSLHSDLSLNSTDFRDKKKCPDTWPTPEQKATKLTYSGTPLRGKKGGKMRQARLNVVQITESNVIDITCSPEFGGGCRKLDEGNIQPLLIKKESIENDDTILPSPTSGPSGFNMFTKESPLKFKKPQLSLKTKHENNKPAKKIDNNSKTVLKKEPDSENQLINNININDTVTYTQEDSINILNPKRLPNNLIKNSPFKKEKFDDVTHCDNESSISLLHQVNHLEDLHRTQRLQGSSPTKPPLAENINITNIPDDDELEQSMSLLQREPKVNKTIDNVKRKIPEFVDVDAGTVRKKADKRLLPGWSCDKCVEFFGELYKDNPELLAKKINECSHHRGVQNPTDRPKTPPGFWNPRWNVPDDTEEFNRRNNVV